MRSQASSESKCRLRTDKLGVNLSQAQADSIGVQAPRCHHLEVLTGCLETLWAANRASDVFFDPLPPDSGYGGGAFSTFFPTCVSSSGPWAPSFPLASCLGLGQLGAGEGGAAPQGSPLPSSFHPWGHIEARPGVWEPRNSCSFSVRISVRAKGPKGGGFDCDAPSSGNTFKSLFECGWGGGGNRAGCSLCSSSSGSLWPPGCLVEVVCASGGDMGVPGLPGGLRGHEVRPSGPMPG